MRWLGRWIALFALCLLCLDQIKEGDLVRGFDQVGTLDELLRLFAHRLGLFGIRSFQCLVGLLLLLLLSLSFPLSVSRFLLSPGLCFCIGLSGIRSSLEDHHPLSTWFGRNRGFWISFSFVSLHSRSKKMVDG